MTAARRRPLRDEGGPVVAAGPPPAPLARSRLEPVTENRSIAVALDRMGARLRRRRGKLDGRCAT